MAENEKIMTTAEVEKELSEQTRIRREKLAVLQQEGKDPYQKVKYARTHTSQGVIDSFDELDGKEVSIAGRIMAKRRMGKERISIRPTKKTSRRLR